MFAAKRSLLGCLLNCSSHVSPVKHTTWVLNGPVFLWDFSINAAQEVWLPFILWHILRKYKTTFKKRQTVKQNSRNDYHGFIKGLNLQFGDDSLNFGNETHLKNNKSTHCMVHRCYPPQPPPFDPPLLVELLLNVPNSSLLPLSAWS